MATGPKPDATAVLANGGRPTKAQARAMDVPDRYDYKLIRHLAGSRIPFSIGYVESLAKSKLGEELGSGEEGVDVAQAVSDAHAWGWIDHLDIGTWMGRL